MAGSWAEKLQLLLPAHDGKAEEQIAPIDGGVAPLREHLPQLEKVLLGCSQKLHRCAFLLTDASKVLGFVALLRQHKFKRRLLIGCVSESQWLLPALDVVVASPEQAFDHRLSFHSFSLKVLLIDCLTGDSNDFLLRVRKVVSSFTGFKNLSVPGFLYEIPSIPWFSSESLLPASAAILRLIPGSTSAAWDSRAYASVLSMFAWAVSNVAVQDWSDVPLLLPGIIRSALSCSIAPVLLAPKDKVDRMINVLQACATEFGLSNLRIGNKEGDHILVTCPEELSMQNYLERLVVIEADTLLCSASAWKVERLVRICRNSSVGLHFSSRGGAVDQLLDPSFVVLPHHRVTMKGVCQFFSAVESEQEKLDRVCDIWKQLERPGLEMAIFCNRSATVMWLAEEMKRRGFRNRTWAFCSEDAHINPDVFDCGMPVLVSNVYHRGLFHVINFDLPDSYDEYVERVGRDRADGRRAKVVINIGTSDQLSRLQVKMVELPRNCSNVWKRLPLLFDEVFFPSKSKLEEERTISPGSSSPACHENQSPALN